MYNKSAKHKNRLLNEIFSNHCVSTIVIFWNFLLFFDINCLMKTAWLNLYYLKRDSEFEVIFRRKKFQTYVPALSWLNKKKHLHFIISYHFNVILSNCFLHKFLNYFWKCKFLWFIRIRKYTECSTYNFHFTTFRTSHDTNFPNTHLHYTIYIRVILHNLILKSHTWYFIIYVTSQILSKN